MPGTGSGTTIPITVYQVKGNSDALPQTKRLLENAGETFMIGVPVYVDSSGYLAVSPTINTTNVIAGFSQEFGHDLATDGTPKTLTYGSVQNQPNAVNIPAGAPLSDGACGVFIADENTIFQGESDSGVTAQDQIGDLAGLTADTNGQWFVDKTITSAGSGAIVEIVALIDPAGTAYGKVAFRITRAGQQFGK